MDGWVRTWQACAVQHSAATVVTLVGPDTAQLLPSLGRAGRVRAITVDPDLPSPERAVAAQLGTGGAGASLAVHDADPLSEVAEAWIRLFDGTGAVGELEVAVAAALQRWRSRAIELPDYYLLLGPDDWEPTRRHWYLGVLSEAAPSRVLPVTGAEGVPASLRRLPAGRWWPSLDRLLDGVERHLPDRLVSLEEDGDAPVLLRPGR